MDRMLPSEGSDVGSIPAKSTIGDLFARQRTSIAKNGAFVAPFFAMFYAFARAIAFARRDFLRDAAFFLITPVFAALSIAL